MNILVVAHTPPWPETAGTRMRLANVIRGLSRLGEIDLFVLANPTGRDVLTVPASAPARRVETALRPESGFSVMRRIGWWTRGRLPSDLTGRDYRAVRARFARWSAGRYDLAWISRVESYVALHAHIEAPTVVDLDDLEDHKISGRLAHGTLLQPGSRGFPLQLYNAAARAQATRNASLWRDLHERIARSVEAVVVCSELDRRRLGAVNGAVIPNGYDYQEKPLGRVSVGTPPTITFQGFHLYPANADAARYLVEEIAPLIRARVPDLRIRLVGRADARVLKLQRPPQVVATGFVEGMATELAVADVIAVPMRFGSGTRIKILEAFAHRVPVVSTTLGAEGLDVIDGREILLADTPEAFANACLRLLYDKACRESVSEAAHQLFLEKYRWDRIHSAIAALGEQVARRPESHLEQAAGGRVH